MEQKEFNKFFMEYKDSDVETKIDMYCTTQDLSEDQYMQLLRAFPANQIPKLEKAVR